MLGTTLDVIGVQRERPLFVQMKSLSAEHRSRTVLPRPAPTAANELVVKHLDALLGVAVPTVAGHDAERLDWPSGAFHEAGSRRLDVPAADDFVFRYPLPSAARAGTVEEYCARVAEILLDVVDVLDSDGGALPNVLRDLSPASNAAAETDGARGALGHRKERQGASGGEQPLHSVASSEPSIVSLGRHLALLMSVLLPRRPLGPRPPSGFRLRQAADWIVPAPDDPAVVYQYLARVCNVACKFCYLYGNPDGLAVARGTKTISQGEVDTRLKYFDPAAGTALFDAEWEVNEFLVDPKLEYVLRRLRRLTSAPFWFITNGNPLNARRIELLAELRPAQIIVSTNTIDVQERIEIMGEREGQTRTSLDSLRMLADARIPFAGSVVALPELSLSSLALTIHQLADTGAAFVRLNLPGFTRSHPYNPELDTDTYWREVVTWAQGLRQDLPCPLIIIPSAYEQNFFFESPNAPRILGSVPGSPAAAAGLRPGDEIRRVGTLGVNTRSELYALLSLVDGPTEIDMARGGVEHTIVLDPDVPPVYPYSGSTFAKYDFPHGIVVPPSIAGEDLRRIRRAVHEIRAQRAWVITSNIMRPAVRELLSDVERDTKIHYVAVTCLFLGGNIRILDMAVVDDIAAAVEEELKANPRPDVIFLPASGFNHHGRDLAGRHVGELESRLGIKVILLHATRQFLF